MSPLIVKDFPPEKFPILFEALNHKTREVVWSTTIEMPVGGSRVDIYIPPLSSVYGPVAIRCTFGDGEMTVTEPPKVN